MFLRLAAIGGCTVGDDVNSVIVVFRCRRRHCMDRRFAALIEGLRLILWVVYFVFVLVLVVRIVLIMVCKPVEQSMSMQMRHAAVLSTWYRMSMGHRSSRKEQSSRQTSDEKPFRHV
jgi:hypothetical protein